MNTCVKSYVNLRAEAPHGESITFPCLVAIGLVQVDIRYLKVQLCKLYNNKYMITLTQIATTEIFASIAALVF